MDGKGHKTFAPIFTGGTTLILTTTGLVPVAGTAITTVVLSMICSELTATLPDADLIALKPKKIIKGTAKKRYSKKYNREYYYVSVSEAEYAKKYASRSKSDNLKIERGGKGYYLYYDRCGTSNILMKHMALIFKAMGLKKHRGFQSHSPLIWVPFWLLMIFLAYKIQNIGVYTGALVLGLGLGWISHLVGDLFTLDGLPIVPKFWSRDRDDIKIAPMGGIKIGKHRLFRFGFAKASNKVWVYMVCFIFFNIFFYILMPDTFYAFYNGIGFVLSKIISWTLTLLGHKS